MTTTPVSLLERLRQSPGADAWGRFVSLYTPLIFAWARRAGLQHQDAADLTQDVFVTLVGVLPTFAYDRHQSFRRWLRTVTLNKWRDMLKKQAGVPKPGLPAAEPATADPDAFWETEFRARLTARALQIMRNDFAPATWRACWEHVVEGRPAPQVAAELGLTTGAVYAAKVRVLARLRNELQGMLD